MTDHPKHVFQPEKSPIGNVSVIHKHSFWKRMQQRFRLLRRVVKYYRLQKLIVSLYNAQAMVAMTKLGLADYLQEKPRRCEELAAEIGLHERSLKCLLHLLAKLDLVRLAQTGQYTLTPLGTYLCSNTSHSLRGTILSMAELAFPACGNLDYSIRTGKAAFDESFQMSFYDYLRQHPEASKRFSQWMKETTREAILPIFDMCRFSHVKTVVDIGGGTGLLLSMLLQTYPHLQGILFDQEDVVGEAKDVMQAAGVTERCRIVGGDFFETVPEGGDIYIIARVLPNWAEEQALQILENCRASMKPSSKLLIIDVLFSEKRIDTLKLVSMLQILSLCGYIQRTDQEYCDLLLKAGFHSPTVAHTGGTLSFIEAGR